MSSSAASLLIAIVVLLSTLADPASAAVTLGPKEKWTVHTSATFDKELKIPVPSVTDKVTEAISNAVFADPAFNQASTAPHASLHNLKMDRLEIASIPRTNISFVVPTNLENRRLNTRRLPLIPEMDYGFLVIGPSQTVTSSDARIFQVPVYKLCE